MSPDSGHWGPCGQPSIQIDLITQQLTGCFPFICQLLTRKLAPEEETKPTPGLLLNVVQS